jgi:uncharacterized protein
MVGFRFLSSAPTDSDLAGTDVFHGAILVSVASLAHLTAGNVNVPMMLSLLLGAISGLLLHGRLVPGVPEPLLPVSLATVLLTSGAQLL